MFCEYEVFSFCTLMPISLVGMMLWHYETVVKCLVYNSGIGNVKFTKTSLEVESVQGKLSVPCLTLPSYDWSVGFFLDNDFVANDGVQSWDVIEQNKHQILPCRIVRNKLICQYMYPHQINGQSRVRGYIGSMFDGECYIFTVENGEPIDYQKYCNKLMVHIEDL